MQKEIHDQLVSASDWLRDRLRKEPRKEIDPVRELEELLKRIDQLAKKKVA